MSKRVIVRASEVPMMLRCPQATKGESRIKTDDVMARLGTCVHMAMAEIVEVRGVLTLPYLAETQRVDVDELERLVTNGRRMWRERLEPEHPRAMAEVPLRLDLGDEVSIRGAADVISMRRDCACVVDWKSGWSRRDYWDQLATYALLAAREMGTTRARAVCAWLRFGECDERLFSPDELSAHQGNILRAAYRTDYVIGDQCDYCPRIASCPAHASETTHAIDSLTGEAGVDVATLAARGDVAELLSQCAMVERAAKHAREAVRRFITLNGELRGQNGKRVGIETQTRRHIDVRRAWPILQTWLGADLADAITIAPGKMEAAVAKGASRGEKGRKKAALCAALEEADAVEWQQTYRLQVRDEEPVKIEEEATDAREEEHAAVDR